MKKYLWFFCLIFCFLALFQGVSSAISISASPSPASAGQSVTFTVSSSYMIFGSPPNCTIEINFGDGSSWRNLSTCTTSNCVKTISHTYTTAGQYTITARSVSGCAPPPYSPDPATTSLTVRCPSLSITSPSTLPQGTLVTAYTYQIQSSGGVTPYAFSITSGALPQGLSMSNSGLISGTPTASGTYNFTVTCTDACPLGDQSQNKSFSISITCPQLNMTSVPALPAGTTGQAYSHQLQSSGGQQPVSFALTAGSLPPGLNLGSSGLISGTPSSAGTYNFTITATDTCTAGIQTAQSSFSINISPAPCPALTIVSPVTLPAGTVTQAFSYQILTSGGQSPVNFTLSSGSLPPGLSLTPTGLISGTPSAAGTSNFSITATDVCPAGAQITQKAFAININPAPCAPLNITSPSILTSGTAGQVYNYQVQATGGQPPVLFELTGGSLPPGLSLSSTGLISGMPSATGTNNFTITATDVCAAGVQSVSRTFSIIISGDVKATVSPSSSRITRNLAWTQNIFYRFSSDSTATITLNSSGGSFRANNTMIGEINTPLTATITNGAGNVSEVLNVPVAISQRAEQAGTSRIIYTRTFTNGTLSVDAQTEIIVTSGAASDFKITRLQLYFENQRAEITVKRNQPLLKAFADIRLSGSGLLTGYWEVDGRVLQYVNRHLVYGNSITLVSPNVPSLPTFSPGTHIVRFVITQPSEDIPVPEAIYFVTAEESEEVRMIGLTMPEDNTEITYSPITFDWQNVKWATTYLIVFSGQNDEKPIFSAYTKDPSYRIPPFILNSLFMPEGAYHWRVKGYDAAGDIIGESPVYGFSFSE